jgi:hypothetical protein
MTPPEDPKSDPFLFVQMEVETIDEPTGAIKLVFASRATEKLLEHHQFFLVVIGFNSFNDPDVSFIP